MSTAVAAAPSQDRRPSPRQVYFIARLALRFAGHELPETKAQASELIQTLSEALEQRTATVDADCPF